LMFFCIITTVRAFSQEKTVDGIVFDKKTNERIAEVNILNTATGAAVYNNLKGEFNIAAEVGDVLIFTKQNYFSDTVKVVGYTSTAVYMKRSAIQLSQVNIHDEAVTPEQQLEATKRDYTKIYGPAGDRDYLSTSPSGRNAERLKGIIQRDYYQNVIDYRYSRTLVGRITSLKDPQLTDFMQKYRPGYYFVVEASDYDFIASIKANYRRYLRRPKAFSLAPLVPPK